MLRRALPPALRFRYAAVIGFSALVVFSAFAPEAGRARADETKPAPVTAKLTTEVTLGAGWRTSLDSSDRSPGFEAVGGGGEVAIGVAWGGFSILAGGRARIGATLAPQLNPDGSLIGGPGVPSGGFYWEGAGSLSLQIYLGERIRARLGADAGRIFIHAPMVSGELSAPLLGGFLSVGFEAFHSKDNRFAGLFVLRLDLDALLTDDVHFPRLSTSLAAGVGFRY